jgi:multisubunit Na+/H+ antiporter MnhC subunit
MLIAQSFLGLLLERALFKDLLGLGFITLARMLLLLKLGVEEPDVSFP